MNRAGQEELLDLGVLRDELGDQHPVPDADAEHEHDERQAVVALAVVRGADQVYRGGDDAEDGHEHEQVDQQTRRHTAR